MFPPVIRSGPCGHFIHYSLFATIRRCVGSHLVKNLARNEKGQTFVLQKKKLDQFEFDADKAAHLAFPLPPRQQVISTHCSPTSFSLFLRRRGEGNIQHLVIKRQHLFTGSVLFFGALFRRSSSSCRDPVRFSASITAACVF